jgi:hypothetical protein
LGVYTRFGLRKFRPKRSYQVAAFVKSVLSSQLARQFFGIVDMLKVRISIAAVCSHYHCPSFGSKWTDHEQVSLPM